MILQLRERALCGKAWYESEEMDEEPGRLHLLVTRLGGQF